MKKKKNHNDPIKTDELVRMLVDSILSETYLNRDLLTVKINAMIKSFRLTISTSRFNSVDTPSRVDTLMRQNHIQNLEKEFWKKCLKNNVGEANMESYYQELDTLRGEWNYIVSEKTEN